MVEQSFLLRISGLVTIVLYLEPNSWLGTDNWRLCMYSPSTCISQCFDFHDHLFVFKEKSWFKLFLETDNHSASTTVLGKNTFLYYFLFLMLHLQVDLSLRNALWESVGLHVKHKPPLRRYSEKWLMTIEHLKVIFSPTSNNSTLTLLKSQGAY